MHAVIKMELKCAGEELVVPSVLPPVGFVVAVDVEMISVVISVLAIAVEVDSELCSTEFSPLRNSGAGI